MKRILNQDQYELSAGERESLWHNIRRQTHGSPAEKGPRGVLRPALLVSAVAATVTLMVAWQLNIRQLTGFSPSERQVASREMSVVEPGTAVPERMLGKTKPAGTVAEEATVEPAAAPEITLAQADEPAEQSIRSNIAQSEPVRDVITDAPVNETAAEVAPTVPDPKAQPEEFRKYAIKSVEDALQQQSGVVMRAGEFATRGGRSDEATLQVDDVAEKRRSVQSIAPTTTQDADLGSVTGGTTAPNGEQVELMYHESAGVNPFVASEDDNLSTFAVDVDNASWTLARNYLARGMLPPKDAIRVEEFVNAFAAGWPQHTDQPFRIHTEGGGSRFGEGYHLLRIGLVGQDVNDQERKPANLIFVIDVSGSMARESRLELVKQALHILLSELDEGDRVGLVVYGSRGEVRLPLTDISQRAKIAAAIDGLHTGGSTNAAAGLALAYEMARQSYDANIINRLVLCSDGVANTGISTEAGGILDVVRQASDEGITLSAVGFGMGNYNDVLMEKLADQGDGNYHYVDKLDEAERVFRENLTSLLQTIAREVKVQVEFEPEFVQRWRLLGYENRDVADQDFRNDQVDAGEVGAGHQVTALYELKLKQPPLGTPGARSGSRSRPARVGTVRVRHEAPAHDTAKAGLVTEIEQTILLSQFSGDYDDGSPGMRVQTVVAEFAELLRHSYWVRGHSLADLVPVADALARELAADEQVQDLARMVRQAADLAAQGDR